MASLKKTVPLTSCGSTTPVGFGTATLARLDAPAAISQMLACAYEAGIRHFDTARVYGHGTMEGQVGRFFRGRREEVTIGTKFGLAPGLPGVVSAQWLGRIKRAVKKVRILRRGAQALAAKATTGRYHPSEARKSLETSLRELGTDYVDVLFIHEGSPAEVSEEGLLAFLREEKQAGRVRSFGLAAQWATVEKLSPSVWRAFDVLQIPSDATTGNLARVREHFSGTVITHSVFAPLVRLRAYLDKSPEVREEWSARIAMDFNDPSVVPRLLWQAALRENDAGITLFSSIHLANVEANMRDLHTRLPDEILRTFVHLASGVPR